MRYKTTEMQKKEINSARTWMVLFEFLFAQCSHICVRHIPLYLCRLRNTHKQYFFMQHIPSLNLHFKSREKKRKYLRECGTEKSWFEHAQLNQYVYTFGCMRFWNWIVQHIYVRLFELKTTLWTFYTVTILKGFSFSASASCFSSFCFGAMIFIFNDKSRSLAAAHLENSIFRKILFTMMICVWCFSNKNRNLALFLYNSILNTQKEFANLNTNRQSFNWKF